MREGEASMEPSELRALANEALKAISGASDPEELSRLASFHTGKGSKLACVSHSLGRMDPDTRKALGAVLHEVRSQLEEAIAAKRAEIEASERERRLNLERMDLTEIISPKERGRWHLVARTLADLEDTFVGMGFVVAEGPEVETDWYNFEALNIPPDHPARGMFDTFYLKLGKPESVMLRTHTSPVQIRLLEQGHLPIYAVMPGQCYRRDTPDARHLPAFHQIEGLVVDEGVTFGDMAGTIEEFTRAFFGSEVRARLRPSYFPFTEPSAEFEVTCTICAGNGCRTCSNTGWMELGGCGMVHPKVLAHAGVDLEGISGFAFGFGIERLAFMRWGIADIRVLVENDIRFSRRS
jgi:phenylalanyl-tRNA synthetase alpha chain